MSANPFVGVNYINDNVRMAVPPAYWLQRLYDFDSELVVFPSRHVPFAYVLARRARVTSPLTNAALASVIDQPDTKFCFMQGLVPVSLIYRTGDLWSIDNIIAQLKARDIWSHGGAEKMADKLDETDATVEERKRKLTRDDMWNRSGDAWRSYQARTGQRTKLAAPQAKKAKPVTEPRTKRSSSRTASAKIVLTDQHA